MLLAGLAGLLATPLAAQQGRLNLSALNLKALEQRAAHFDQVTLDGATLRSALAGSASAEPQLRAMLSQLRGVYIYDLKFSAPGQYPASAIRNIERQLSSGSWHIIVRDQSRKETALIATQSGGEETTAQITLPPDGRHDGGPIRQSQGGRGVSALAIVDAEPTELSIVNVVGQFPGGLASLKALDGLSALGRSSRRGAARVPAPHPAPARP